MVFYPGLQFLDDEDLRFPAHEGDQSLVRLRIGEAELEERAALFEAELTDGVAGVVHADAVGDDAERRVSRAVHRIEGGGVRAGLASGKLLDELPVQGDAVGGHADVAAGVFRVVRGARRRGDLAVFDDAAAMSDARRGAHDDGHLHLMREPEGLDGHVLHVLRRGRLQHGHAEQARKGAVVLLVLAGEQAGVVGVVDDQGAKDVHVADSAEGV